jgi:hypothetical protein
MTLKPFELMNPRAARCRATVRRAVLLAATLTVLGGCKFQSTIDNQFGDQNFKTAVALIELHKVRTGAYPESLKDLKFVGAWDLGALSSVEYRLLDGGYELNVTRGWAGRPDMKQPEEFWKGLGAVKSNMKR